MAAKFLGKAQIEEMKTLAAKGMKYAKIASHLNGAGFSTNAGSKFDVAAVSNVLRRNGFRRYKPRNTKSAPRQAAKPEVSILQDATDILTSSLSDDLKGRMLALLMGK